jgi:hypothetical protein
MKTMFLTAATALLLLSGVAQAEPNLSHELRNEPQEAAISRTAQPSQALNQLQMYNPTGLPSYELRPNGLLLNGLLPANGWQG